MFFNQQDTTAFYQRAFFTGVNPNNFVVLKDVNTSYAVFGQLSYELLPNLTITAGGRETKDTKETRLLKSSQTVGGADQFPASAARYIRLSDSKPSWDVSALYQATPDLSVYARVAKGFRGPTIQGRSAVFNSAFTTANSETILSYEAGFKSAAFDNKLRFNATGFTYTVKNIQLNGNDADGNGVLFNADKAKAYGMEADLEFRPSSRLILTGGASLLHSEIKDKRVYAQVCAQGATVVCTVQDPTIVRPLFGTPTTFAQIDGNPLPNAPKYNFNITARYGIPIGDHGEVFIATDWNIQGYTSFVLYKTAEFTSKGNFEGGAKLGYVTGDGKYEMAVFARNITNEKNLKGVIENYMAAVFNDPRVIGVSAAAKF